MAPSYTHYHIRAPASSDEELFALPRSTVLHLHASSLTKQLSQPLPDSDPWLPLILTIIYELLRARMKNYSLCPVRPSSTFTLLPSRSNSVNHCLIQIHGSLLYSLSYTSSCELG